MTKSSFWVVFFQNLLTKGIFGCIIQRRVVDLATTRSTFFGFEGRQAMLDRFEQFSYSIHNIYKYITKIERDVMEKYGLRGAYAQYLVIMSRFPEGITSSKLSEICDKDKAAISRIVAEMEDKGLLVRRTDKDNLYRARLVLTDEGVKAAEYVCEKATRAVALAGGNLGEEERGIMYGSLAIIETNLRRISRDGIPDRACRKQE